MKIAGRNYENGGNLTSINSFHVGIGTYVRHDVVFVGNCAEAVCPELESSRRRVVFGEYR